MQSTEVTDKEIHRIRSAMERHNRDIAQLSLQEVDLANQLVRDLEMYLVLNKQLQKLGDQAKNDYLSKYANDLREETDKQKQEL